MVGTATLLGTMGGGPQIPIVSVRLGKDEERLVLETIRSGQLAQGPMVARLEELFVDTVGTEHAVAVGSGTAALYAALRVLDLQPGDEVITSPLTFPATVNAIVAAGVVARFADVGEDLTMDPDSVAYAVNDRTRVILPVHLYGLPADMGRLSTLADTEDLDVVEDAAQAVGASVGGRPAGSFGLGCFSLYATKTVTTGEGGVVTTDDGDLADELRVLRNQGMRERYDFVRVGDNLRLTDVQAALGIPQMEHLAELTERRRANAATMNRGLEGIPGLKLPEVPPGRTHSYHQYTVEVGPEARLDRAQLAAALDTQGIGTAVHYPRVVLDYLCYSDHPQVMEADVPRARLAAGQVLSLPVHQHLDRDDLDTVIASVRHLLGA